MTRYLKLALMFLITAMLLSFVVKKKKPALEHLLGKVKWFTLEEFEISNDEHGLVHFNLSTKKHEEFDSAGRVIMLYNYNSDKLIGKNEKVYDSKGRIVQEKFFNAQDVLTRSTTTSYIKKRVNSETVFSKYDAAGEIVSSDRKNYDKVHRIKKEIVNDYKNSLVTITTSHYVVSANEASANRKDIPVSKNDTYDEKGNLVERNIYNEDSTLKIKYTWAYNAEGKQTEFVMYVRDSNALNMQNKAFYDNYGRVLSAYWYDKGKVTTVTTNHYVTDPVGNWIIDSVFENDVFMKLRQREIQYY